MYHTIAVELKNKERGHESRGDYKNLLQLGGLPSWKRKKLVLENQDSLPSLFNHRST